MEAEEFTFSEAHEGSSSVPIDDKRCSSDYDIVTLVDWTDAKPDVYINFLSEGGSGALNCYNAEGLQTWLSDPDNTLYRWNARPNTVMDNDGHGGEPDRTEGYVKLYTGEYVQEDSNVNDLRNGMTNVFYNANTLERDVRLGNRRGTLGVSQSHGQTPGYHTYKLVRTDILKPQKPIPRFSKEWFVYENKHIAFFAENDKEKTYYKNNYFISDDDEDDVFVSNPVIKIIVDGDTSDLDENGNINRMEGVKLLIHTEGGLSFYIYKPHIIYSIEVLDFLSEYIDPKIAKRFVINHLINKCDV